PVRLPVAPPPPAPHPPPGPQTAHPRPPPPRPRRAPPASALSASMFRAAFATARRCRARRPSIRRRKRAPAKRHDNPCEPPSRSPAQRALLIDGRGLARNVERGARDRDLSGRGQPHHVDGAG